MPAGTTAVDGVDEWYHTLHLPDGPTPGLFDLGSVADQVPWPDLAGRRCLDVATFDGYWAFELERRGAGEVVAIDLPDFADVDWLPRRRHLARTQATGAGFRRAAAELDSKVQRVESNVYDLRPDDLGQFDVVMLGALLLHLRSPFQALESVRRMVAPTGLLITVEQVDPVTTFLHPRRPLLSVRGSLDWTWTVPNAAGHRRMLEIAGFEVLTPRRLALTPYGGGASAETVRDARRLRRRSLQRLLGQPGHPGLMSSILLARPLADIPVAKRDAEVR